jgi:hypothetical protein
MSDQTVGLFLYLRTDWRGLNEKEWNDDIGLLPAVLRTLESSNHRNGFLDREMNWQEFSRFANL